MLCLATLTVGAQTNSTDSLGRKQGFWRQKDAKNSTIECFYINNMLDGPYRVYNTRSQLVLETRYDKDTLNGPYTQYGYEKVLIRKMNYVNGTLDGKSEWYDSKGRLLEAIDFNKGRLNGAWKKYFKGKLITEAQFHDGILDGDFIRYYEDGTVSFKSIFRDGKLVSGEMYYTKKGKLAYIKMPTATRDRLGGIVYFNDDGIHKEKTKNIDELPISHLYFGAEVHKSGKLEPGRDEEDLNN